MIKKTRKKLILILILCFLFLLIAGYYLNQRSQNKSEVGSQNEISSQANEIIEVEEMPEEEKEISHPMAIESLQDLKYPSGDFEITETLADGPNYKRYLASYESEGLVINGLLTVPIEEKPAEGYPAIMFIHGYIPPDQYSTINSYPTYQAILARAGFITYKPDLRGHDDSEGEAVSAHTSAKYIIDTLNAIAYLKNYPDTNPSKIGYWGHSNGGQIGLRVITISEDIKAAVFWAGVVGSYQDMLETYVDKIPFLDQENNELVRAYDLPSKNPDFWNKLEPYNYLDNISAPVQLHHATGDQSVPIELSESLNSALEEEGKTVEYYEYQGDDHNIAQNSGLAWQTTIDFFQRYLR